MEGGTLLHTLNLEFHFQFLDFHFWMPGSIAQELADLIHAFACRAFRRGVKKKAVVIPRKKEKTVGIYLPAYGKALSKNLSTLSNTLFIL